MSALNRKILKLEGFSIFRSKIWRNVEEQNRKKYKKLKMSRWKFFPDLRNMNFYVRDSCQSLQPRITLSIKQLFHDYKIKYSEICSICI